MDEVASRNKKKTATASSETILTALCGCRARTLAASSCTVMETDIRRAMSTSSVMNASIPLTLREDFVSGLMERPNHPFLANSVYASLTVRGSAPNTTERARTTAISSSSPSCASLAASRSSRAMPKDTENARSLPSAPSASVVEDMQSDRRDDYYRDSYEDEPLPLPREVFPSEVEACAQEGCSVGRRLAWQNERVRLHVRRLLLSDRGGASGGSKGVKGVIKKRRRLTGGTTVSCTVGTIFGSTLGNLFHYARGHKHGLAVARLRLELVVDPAAAAAGSTRGEDRIHLMRGMGHHRVVGSLGKSLAEVRTALPISDRKKGGREAHVGVVYGATVALLVSFSLLSLAQMDEADMEPLVEPACEELHNHLDAWRTGGVSWVEEDRAALAAEIRASERALQAVRLARQRAQTARMGPAESTRMQLAFFRRAAWPVGHSVGFEEQDRLLEKLRTGELVDLEPEVARAAARPPQVVHAPGVLPLSALVFGPRSAVGEHESGSDEARSSCASSSLGSWASSCGPSSHEGQGHCGSGGGLSEQMGAWNGVKF